VTLRWREIETLEYRVLGAVRFVDATTRAQIRAPLEVRAAGVRWIRNRSNLYVVAHAPGLGALAERFVHPDPSADPLALPDVAVAAVASDPSGRYLPCSFQFALPRDPDPANAEDGESLFQPVEVELYPASIAEPSPGWAVLRASVVDDATGRGVGGALVRVVRPGAEPDDDEVLARGLSDERGEAFVPVPGIPVMTFSDDENAVLTNEVSVRLEAFANPLASRPVNPAAIEDGRATLPFDELNDVPLKAGETITRTLRIRPRAP
jgi:hypothetical protein